MRVILLKLLFVVFASQLTAQQWPTPFEVELEEVTWTDWPGLHSFAHGEDNGKWFIIGGRTGGMHSLIPPDPFPVAEANLEIRMFDPLSGEQWSRSIYELPDSIAAPLRGTNPQFLQRDNMLYYMGGYGKDTLTEDFITHPVLIAINLELLQDALESESSMDTSFRLLRDSLFYLCGAEAEWLNDTAFLFGGHEFTGEYSQIPSINFEQRYPNELRKFVINDDGINLSISDVSIIYDSLLFHRRDLSFEPLVFPDESFGLAAYSGVFQYESNTPWLSNIYFDSYSYWEDTLTQRFNNYTCPVLNMYDPEEQAMYAILFGGISQFWYDEGDSAVYEDLNIPFVNDISVVTRTADGGTSQDLLPISFEHLYGSNAAFFPADGVLKYGNGVVDLSGIEAKTLVGYIFGGIDPEFPNFTLSVGSNALYKVFVQPSAPATELEMSEKIELTVFPNPVTADFISLEGIIPTGAVIEWMDIHGRIVSRIPANASISAPRVNGFYLFSVYTPDGSRIFKQEVVVNR